MTKQRERVVNVCRFVIAADFEEGAEADVGENWRVGGDVEDRDEVVNGDVEDSGGVEQIRVER